MSNKFLINYNGQNINVNVLENEIFLVQITYKPLQLKRILQPDGLMHWVDVASNLETNVTKQIGDLITKKLGAN